MSWKCLNVAFLVWVMTLSVVRAQSKSLLDSDPDVVYLAEFLDQPVQLSVVEEVPVFSDKKGMYRIGTLLSNQTVIVDAITEKAYRVRGKGMKHDLSGWVAPWAFTSKNPDFQKGFKDFYQRQMTVKELIARRQIAVGMTLKEVKMIFGEPTKKTDRHTAEGSNGIWEYVEYKEVKNYATVYDPETGMTYKRLVSVTKEETSRLNVEHDNGSVKAFEQSQSMKGSGEKITVPALTYFW